VSVTTDEDLYDLIRLCALGQDWNPSLAAAKKYLAGGAVAHRSQAYSLSINALVHINDLDGAVEAAHEMLQDVPYDAEVGYTTQFLKTYLTQAVDPKALSFAMEEHGALVEALKSGSTLKSLHGEAVMGVGTLYESGMQLAFLERYAGDERGAARTVLELEAAVAASQAVTAADRQLMEAVRKQYGLVGSVLPEIDAQGLTSATAAAKKFRSDVGFVTIVEVFPDYCPQCVKTMAGLTEFAAEHVAAKVHAYGLVIRDDRSAVPPDSWKDLKPNSTYAVKPEAVQMLWAIDYPFLVVTDEHGLVYYVGAIPSNAFVPNGYMEQVIGRIVGELAVVRNPVGGKSKPMVKKPM
jgi:thiol-disulfide isomerase/thioredoxin